MDARSPWSTAISPSSCMFLPYTSKLTQGKKMRTLLCCFHWVEMLKTLHRLIHSLIFQDCFLTSTSPFCVTLKMTTGWKSVSSKRTCKNVRITIDQWDKDGVISNVYCCLSRFLVSGVFISIGNSRRTKRAEAEMAQSLLSPCQEIHFLGESESSSAADWWNRSEPEMTPVSILTNGN